MASAALLKASATESPTLPQFPPYREPHFVSAVQIARKACGDARDFLTQWPDPKPLRCYEEMKRLADDEHPTEFMVGVIGVSGVGKSSTINSVLDQQDLAKAEACGTAVTHYPIEYRQSTSDQQAEYVFEAKLQPFDSLHLYLAQLLRNYHREQVEEDVDNMDPSMFAEMKSDQAEAKNILDALFGHMQSYGSATLSIGADHNMEPALARLTTLAETLKYPEGTDAQGVWRGEANTTESLNEKQSLIITSGLWPIVETVKITSKTQTLGRHLVVVDLPGNRDTNVARVNSAMRYQSRCDLLLAVVDMKRAIDDSLVEETVQMVMKKPTYNGNMKRHLAVVCTRSGVLSTNSEEQKLRGKVKNQSRLMHLLKSLDDLAKNEDMPVKAYKKQEKNLRRDYLRMLIEARNGEVSAKLKSKYDARLEIFCVDNTLYWDDDLNNETERETSGIHQLREFLTDLPHESLFKHQNSFLRHDFPASVASVQTWVITCLVNDQRLDERKEAPQAQALEASIQQLHCCFDKIDNSYSKHVNSVLRRSQTHIQDRCVDVLQPLNGWKSSSFRAWIIHRGTHTTRGRGYACWNRDIVQCFANVLEHNWARFTAETRAYILDFNLQSVLNWKTYSQQCSSVDPGSPIAISVTTRLLLIEDCIRNSMREYDESIAKIQYDAMTMHQACYVKQLMEQGYAEASWAHGKGSTKKQYRILLDYVASDNFVRSFRHRVYDDYKAALRVAREKIGIAS